MSKLHEHRRKRADNKRMIQQELDKLGLNQAMAAARAGLTPQALSATLNGLNDSQNVLNALRELGVSEKYLFNPRDYKRKVV